MTSHDPAVSVIVPMHDARDHIVRGLESLRAQTLENFEVLVVDDASHDGSADLVEAIGDDRVRLIRLSRNVGPAGARNVALDVAQAPWVTVLDADDVFHPQRLEMLHHHAHGLGTGTVLFDAVQHLKVRNGRLIPLRVANRLPGEAVCPHAVEIAPPAWLRSGRAVKPFLSTEVARSVRYPEGIRFGEDYLFVATVVASTAARMVQLQAPLYGYVLRAGSLRSDAAARAALAGHLERWVADHAGLDAAAAVGDYARTMVGTERGARPGLGLRRGVRALRLRAENLTAVARSIGDSPMGRWPVSVPSGRCRVSEPGEHRG